MSRIELNVVATGNFKNLETSLARLRSQVAALNTSMAGGRGGDVALTQVGRYVQGFEQAIDASGMFERHMVSITSETQKFGRSLESGNMRIGQLFRAAKEYRRGELGQIRQLAREQVRMMNATTVMMPDGRAQVIVPRGIDEAIDKQRILNQEYRIFRQVVRNGSTEIINWGKNTQWAGRQLTVGLTVPLTIFGATAGKMFMDADKQLVRLAKVYGDATKGMVDSAELDKIRSQTLALSQELASGLGVAAAETMGIAADIAATGREGNELLESTREAIRLSVLGEVDRQEAMRATLSIQSVFKKDTEGLADSINLLNAVENQTSTSLNDLVEGIVKAGPVVQGLGGDIEDLALMMVAMREGGIPASEAANAIKSSLASLINPTKQTRDVLNKFGIDLVGIVDKNAGNVIGTLVDLQSELAGLNDLSRQRAIEQIFGKFQFSRINAMLSNIGRAGSQTEQVLAIAGMSTAELAETADRELTAMTESVSGKFGRALETLKANLIPVGEAFVQIGTFLMNVGNKVLEVFNAIPEPIQNIIKGLGFLTALAGPIIMITGVLGNFFGYIVKGISSILALKKAGTGMFTVFTPESVAASRATETLTDSLFDQKIAMGEMGSAVDTLVQKLSVLIDQLNNVQSASSGVNNVMANAEARASMFSGDVNEPAGSEFFHRLPNAKIPMSERGSASVGSALRREDWNIINGIIDQTTIPVLSGIPELDNPAIEVVRQKLAKSNVVLSPQQEAELYLPSASAATEAAVPTAYAEAFGRMRAAGATTGQIKATELQFRKGYLQDPQNAIATLSAEFESFGVSLSQTIQEIEMELERAYRQVIESGGTVEEATEAMYRRSIELEQSAKSAVDDVLSFPVDKKTGRLKKRSATAGQLMLQEGLTKLGLETGVSEEVKAATQRELELQNRKNQIEQEILANKQEQSKLEKEIKELKRTEKSRNKRIAELQAKKPAERTDEERRELRRLTAERKKLADKTKQLERVTAESAQLEEKSQQTQQELIIAQEQKTEAIKISAQQEVDETKSSQNNENAENIDTVQTLESAISEERETQSSNRLADAENKDAASINKRGFFRGGKLGMGISALSMAGMFIPTGDPNTGTGQALGAAQDIATFTGMGAMFGAPGIAIGASIGVLKAGFDLLGRKAEEAAAELAKIKAEDLASVSGILDLEKQIFDINPFKGVEDVPLGAFNLKTEEAVTRLEEFARALKEAEPDSAEAGRVREISSMDSARDLVSSPMFQRMITEMIYGGADKETVKSIIGGYLGAAGKTEWATVINSQIESIFDLGNSPEEIGARYLQQLQEIADRVIAESGYSTEQGAGIRSAQQQFESSRAGAQVLIPVGKIGEGGTKEANIADLSLYLKELADQIQIPMSDFIDYLTGTYQYGQEGKSGIDSALATFQNSPQFSALQDYFMVNGEGFSFGDEDFVPLLNAVKQLIEFSPDLNNITDIMGNLGNESALMADSLISALAQGEQSFDKYLNATKETEDSINSNNQLIDELKNRMMQVDPAAGKAFNEMVEGGVAATDALRIITMLIDDVNTDWRALADMAAANPIQFRAEIWTTYVQGNQPFNIPAAGATAPENAGDRLTNAIDWSTGSSGGGGSPDTSAIDEQIEAQDKLIEKIKEEREERQKLLNLEKEAYSFAMKEQDLKNQIAQARAEGRMADAALLQSQLDNERELNEKQEAERRRQEQEDKKIKAAEKEKERLQEQKQGMSSGGGGGGGGSGGPSEAQKQWTANRIDILTSGVVNWTEGAELRAATLEKGPWSAFFESEKVKNYREELEKLGVPLELIDEELNGMFESWINNNNELFGQTEEYQFIKDALGDLKIGAEGVKEILPEAFSVLLDKNLTDNQKIQILSDQIYDLGYESDEARRKAEKLYKQYNENEFKSPGIDEEIQKWISFNDTVDSLKKDLESLTSEGGALSADAARWTGKAIEDLEGGRKINAGGIQIDTNSLGQDLVTGLTEGMDTGFQAQKNAIQDLVDRVLGMVKGPDGFDTQSPSKKFIEIGQDVVAGLAEGVADGEGYKDIEDAFSSMIDDLKDLIIEGFIELPDEVSDPIKNTSDTFYNIMTEGIRETVDEINNIISNGIKDYEFKIQGMPGVYIPASLDNFWRSALPGVYNNLSNFGQIYRAQGGYVSGPGGPTEDKIPAWLSDGEYVIKASSVEKYGIGLLDTINAGRFADGGFVKVSDKTSPLGQSIADFARPFVGTPYSSSAAWADGPENGWGCATAMQWLYNQKFGINLPSPSLSAGQLAGLPNSVGRDSLLPGDLLFFYYKNGVNTQNPVNHVGMYMGNEQMFHARAPGLGTQITGIDDANYKAARRVVPQADIGMQFPRRYKSGGKVYGLGSSTQDNLLAMLSNGEYVMSAMSVKKYGQDFMEALNKGELAEAAAGGMMSKYPGSIAKLSTGSNSKKYFSNAMSESNNSNVEYNINVQVLGTNSSPDDIAKEVMKALKQREHMNGSRTRI